LQLMVVLPQDVNGDNWYLVRDKRSGGRRRLG
jgi:hypothetical protein